MSERKTFEGVVFKVYNKAFSGRETFTIKLDGIKIWLRCNTERYAGIAEPGNRITLEADMLPDGESAKVVPGSVKLAGAPAPVAASGTPVTAGYGDPGRQNSIVYQSSLKAALDTVAMLLQTGALDLKKVQSKKAGIIEAAIDRYTAQFFNDVNTLGAVTRESESADAETEAEAEEGSEDEE